MVNKKVDKSKDLEVVEVEDDTKAKMVVSPDNSKKDSNAKVTKTPKSESKPQKRQRKSSPINKDSPKVDKAKPKSVNKNSKEETDDEDEIVIDADEKENKKETLKATKNMKANLPASKSKNSKKIGWEK